MIRVEGNRVHAETRTFKATIDRGLITSLVDKGSGAEHIGDVDADARAALELVYPRGETVGIGEGRFGSVACRALSEHRAEFRLTCWDGDGVIAVSEDPETGDLIVEPSAYSARAGVRACRWNVTGVRDGLSLVAPLFQGVRMDPADPLLKGQRWNWPHGWEAGLIIFEGKEGGFWIHARDARYRPKALVTGSGPDGRSVGLDAEAHGPIDGNLSAGGLGWRVNVFRGDWKVPAGAYRDWLWRACALGREQRPEWMRAIGMAVSWCPCETAVLDALAEKVDPGRVLLHVPDWRADSYDENYPTYVASGKGRAFVRRGREMGFRVMPHFNAIDMDPTHPVYASVRDFCYRDVETKKLQGWVWAPGESLGGPPSSNARLLEHRRHKVMVKIHPGLAAWRSILGENVQEAAEDLGLETVFLDVALNTWNLHNALVENTSCAEGMQMLLRHVAELGEGLVLGGEGLNETTARHLSFGQVHLFRSWQDSADGLERTGGCALNEFLFGGLCRTFGYTALGGRNEGEELRMRIHEEHGTIPTVTIHSADEIASPNPAVARVLALAGG